MARRSYSWLIAALSISYACGDDPAPTGARDAGALDARVPSKAECVPTRASYDEVRPLFVEWCGECHTTEPQFGAPFSLLEYESVLGTHEDGYIVDHMADELREREMPPAEQPQPDEASRAKLIAFATCAGDGAVDGGVDGGGNPDDAGMDERDGGHVPQGGLQATRSPVMPAATPPAGATAKDLTANEASIGVNARDEYKSFDFSSLTSKDVFIRRFDPVIDDSRVVHHLTLRYTNGRQGYLYTWAPGGPSMDFPNGGVRLRSTDTLRLEIHYNNGAHVADVKDSSGVRVWLSSAVGTEYGVANLATWGIFVPDGQKASATATCNVENAAHVYAASPHMHGIGDSFTHIITRKSGAEEDLVSLTGWSFTAQRYYDIGVDLAAGDTLKLTCNYDNDTGKLVTAGVGTADEMCFDFVYVTPPDALENCNDQTSL